MTTSDRHEQGPLTRKQLREIRMTGSTPVITDSEAAAAAAAAEPPEQSGVDASGAPEPERGDRGEPTASDDAIADAPLAAAPDATLHESLADSGTAPLTRRQARTQERIRTESVPVIDPTTDDVAAVLEEPSESSVVPVDVTDDAAVEDAVIEEVIAEDPSESPQGEPPATEVVVEETSDDAAEEATIVSSVPGFSVGTSSDAGDDDDADSDDQVLLMPVSASSASTSAPTAGAEERDASEGPDDESSSGDEIDAMLGLEPTEDAGDADDVLADVGSADDDVAADERPTVNPAFGQTVLAEEQKPFAPSFDELLTSGDSSGSQHSASSALIFTPSPGGGSLSGPVASTGEILVTGSYELPRGIGSQGHAHGVADGKDVDAVLIDGELAPASSPTPIAASSAVSTIKPAGEIIRPPAPEKGNKLMLILAIVAGGLALALGVVLVVAFTTNVF